jgi:hypothetical protein
MLRYSASIPQSRRAPDTYRPLLSRKRADVPSQKLPLSSLRPLLSVNSVQLWFITAILGLAAVLDFDKTACDYLNIASWF